MTDEIRSRSAPDCPVCAAQGRVLYARLRDRLFGAPGNWTLKVCSDASCGLIWLDPMPLEDDIATAYRDYYTHATASRGLHAIMERLLLASQAGYLNARFGYRSSLLQRCAGLLAYAYPGLSAFFDFGVMWLPASRRGRLLDVGAGDGTLLLHMGSLGWEAEGLDFDPGALEQARRRGLRMHLGDLRAQGFPGDSFDAVTLRHSIEHVHGPAEWLRECRRILKPGGWMVIATPNSASLGHRFYREHWFCLDPPRHLHLFNMHTLGRLLSEAGFSRVRLFTSVRDAHGVFRASHTIRREGRFQMGGPQSPLLRAAGRAVQLAEALALRFKRDAGEDLIAIAEKAGNGPAQ